MGVEGMRWDEMRAMSGEDEGCVPLMTWLRCWAESVRETARIRRGLDISMFAFSALIFSDYESMFRWFEWKR